MIRSSLTLAAFLSVVSLAGCDAVGNDTVSVRGRVVDAQTGEAPSPGPATVSVTGAQFLGPTATLLDGHADADGRFDLSADAEGYGEFGVVIGSTGRIEYPGTDASDALSAYDPYRLAYFSSALPYRSGLGTVELVPTCMAIGEVQFSRPLDSSEQSRVRLESIPAVPPTTVLNANGFTYEGSPAEGETRPDTLRLLAPGGRTLRLMWEISEYTPPAGNGEGVFAEGSIELPTCPRHDVLRYAATIPLPS